MTARRATLQADAVGLKLAEPGVFGSMFVGKDGYTRMPAATSIPATALGFSTSNTDDQNSAALATWAADTSFNSTELLFDQIGTFSFADRIGIPLNRTLRGVSPLYTTLKYTGDRDLGSGTGFIYGTDTVFYVKDMVVSTRDGSTLDGLLDYVIETHGTLSPNVAGATGFISGVYAQFGGIANFRALNSTLVIGDCFAYGAENTVLLESCSESAVRRCRFNNWTQRVIWNRGKNSPGAGYVNGAALTVDDLIAGANNAPPYGIDCDGAAAVAITSARVEGPSTAAFRFRNKSTNCHATKTRSNGAGTHVVFDGAIGCTLEGQCTSTQLGAEHINNSRGCEAGLVAESDVGHIDVVQKFGTKQWQGYRRRVGGPLYSVANTVPSDGYHEVADQVFPLRMSSGNPMGWRCDVNGQPITMTGSPNVTFAAVGGTADTITRSAGSFVTDGFIAGAAIVVTGSSSNNNTFTLATVTATVLTLTAASPNLVNEGPVGSVTIRGTGVFLSIGNYP